MELDPRQPEDARTADRAGERNETGCCPRFAPEPWQDQEISWRDKPFIREHVRSLFHIPLNVSHVHEKEQAVVAQAHAEPAENIVLSDETSLWGADYYFAVSKEVPGAEMHKMSGTFLTRVFEGPYRNMSKWIESMRDAVAMRGRDVEHLYFWYTTCPRCAKAYGENYVVLFAKMTPP